MRVAAKIFDEGSVQSKPKIVASDAFIRFMQGLGTTEVTISFITPVDPRNIFYLG